MTAAAARQSPAAEVPGTALLELLGTASTEVPIAPATVLDGVAGYTVM